MLNCRVEWLTRVSFRRWACSAVPWPPGSSDLSWVSLVCRQTPWMPPTKEVRETHTKNYSPVTIFHFFDVLSSMRMWVCYLMQSCLLPPPVVLLSLLIHVFFLYILKIYLYFFPVRCGGVCQSHAGDQRRLQREERGRWGHESGLELTPPTSLNWVPVKICDSFHFSISLDLLFSVMLS